MEFNIVDRAKNAWNAFRNRDPTIQRTYDYSYSIRPDRTRFTRGNEKTISSSIYTRIAIDASNVVIKHCRIDDNGRYIEDMDSHLNDCLNERSNLDQTSRAFFQSLYMSLMDEGCIAVVPTETSENIFHSNSYDIYSIRIAKIVEWFPTKIKVEVYNQDTGKKEQLILPKNDVAIIENPFYSIMNEPNSTLRRLIRKLSLLDTTDEQTASGKLDMIIQLPYLVKTDSKRKQAEERRKDIEMQLATSKYGIAYIDGTEKVTQLNRSLENNLLKQIEMLRTEFYDELGLTKDIINGSADEQAMLNYNSRIIEPLVSSVVDEMKTKFLSHEKQKRKQTIMYFIDPFKLVPVNNIAEMADKFTRNEIMTSNEMRQVIGLKPSSDPKADMLINSNLNHSPEEFGLQNGKNTTNNEQIIDEGGDKDEKV